MGFTTAEYLEMQTRLTNASRKRLPIAVDAPLDTAAARLGQVDREIGKNGLQSQIAEWCDAQWPRWVYDFPRTDQKSTLPLGRHDATVWGPFPKCVLIETKAKWRKRTQEQQIWATRMRAIGWEVHLIYSMDEFLKVVEKAAT